MIRTELKLANRRLGMVVMGAMACCLLSGAIAAHADDDKAPVDGGSGLVNISTPGILAPRQMSFGLDARVFGSDENTSYIAPSFRMGFAPSWEVALNTSLAQFRTYNGNAGAIQHGGTDVELSAKYATRQSGKFGLSYQAGIGLPHTPAQKSPSFTAGLAGSYTPCSYLDLYINPRTVMIQNNAVLGLGLGAKMKITKQISFISDYTAILSGSNTIDVNSGNQRSHDVYGAAFRYSVNKSISVDLGWTNGIGSTTGMSLTPGLDNSSAFYFKVNLSR